MIDVKFYDGTGGETLINRQISDYGEYETVVDGIIADVRNRGDEALIELGEKFDKVKLQNLKVSEQEWAEAEYEVDENFKSTLVRAANNIKAFHSNQSRDGFTLSRSDGVVLGQRITPLQSVGVYVPGGTASYPSTVLMDVIPAVIAGVSQIVMATPPQSNGKIKPEILVAAKIAGVNEIYKIGGAGAIAALAYGTESVPKVDKIVGPGNIFVALAKKRVYGVVGIDMVAGPSEILIIADESANPKYIAADMLSQAEHDALASAVTITDSKALAQEVAKEVEIRLQALPRKDIAQKSIESNGKIIVVSNVLQAIQLSNRIAPEHLELAVKDAMDYLPAVTNAGSVFLGQYTPEALGDYYAGPNHTLPTGGNARFSSPLGVDDFVKRSSFCRYTKENLISASRDVIAFAKREGLDGHANAVAVRAEEK